MNLLKLNIFICERCVLLQINLEMIGQSWFINVLMVVRFADEVNHSLHDQSNKNDQCEHHRDHNSEPKSQSDTHVTPTHNSIPKRQLHSGEVKLNHHEDSRHRPLLTSYQTLALPHGGDAVSIFNHRHYAGKVPHYADVHHPGEVRQGQEGGE